MADGSGLNPKRAEAQRFSLHFPMPKPMKHERQPLVLVVEDSAADADLIKYALAEEQLAIALELARDGAKALEFIDRVDDDDSHPAPDLVLLDLNLPKASGQEVLKRI